MPITVTTCWSSLTELGTVVLQVPGLSISAGHGCGGRVLGVHSLGIRVSSSLFVGCRQDTGMGHLLQCPNCFCPEALQPLNYIHISCGGSGSCRSRGEQIIFHLSNVGASLPCLEIPIRFLNLMQFLPACRRCCAERVIPESSSSPLLSLTLPHLGQTGSKARSLGRRTLEGVGTLPHFPA